MLRPGIEYIGVSVAFYCHDGKGNFLLHKRSDKCRDEIGMWDVGGGQLEFGETPEEAVLREIKEEYGVDGTIEKKLPFYSLIRKHEGVKTHWVIISFIVKVDRSIARNNHPLKIAEISWFRLDNLPEPLHQGPETLLKTSRNEFAKYL